MTPRVALPFACAALLGLMPAGRAAAAEMPAGPAVELPPMVVSEKTDLLPWLYTQVDDTEYLARCKESTVRGYAAMRRSRMQWVNALFPAELFVRMDVPVVTLLMSQRLKPANQEVIGQAIALQERGDAKREYVRASTAPNMALNDVDAVAIFAYIDEDTFERDSLTIASDYLRFLIEQRRPAVPVWLREGMLGVYNDIQFAEEPITLRPLAWHSPAEARALAKNAAAPRVLLPMGELFSDAPRITASPTARAQYALLVRWALDPRNGRREAFWRFARRACEEPVTEKLFESFFGFGFSDLRDRLSDYLPAALRGPLQLPLGPIPKATPITVRRATPAEIARLRGDWERLSVPLVRRRHPEHAWRYLTQARGTLQRAHESGDRDPRTLAIRGLCEIDAGETEAARELLEASVAAAVVRPRAYHELAKLRWAALTEGQPAARAFATADLAPVIGPLRTGLRQAPALADSAVLLAEVWLRGAGPLPEADGQQLETLARLFAADARVCMRVAEALGRHGETARAVAVLGAGFVHVRDDATRREFAQRYAALAKQP